MTGQSVLVLGMHRAGTSMLSRVLSLLLHYEGSSHAGRGNPAGHWEDLSMRTSLNGLLRSVGGSWWLPPPVDTDWSNSAIPSLAKVRAQKALAQRREPIWVWKDPRISITLGFWLSQPRFSEATIVVGLRSPSSVARSLERRNRMPQSVGLKLWDHYYRSICMQSAGREVLWWCAEDLVQSTEESISGLARQLSLRGLSVDSPDRAVQTIRTELMSASSKTSEEEPLYRTLSDLAGTWSQAPRLEVTPETEWHRPDNLDRREIALLVPDAALRNLRTRRIAKLTR